MSSFDLRPDLAARLDALVPAEALAGDWADVVRRTHPRRRRAPRSLKVALALCLLLLLAVIATATYLEFVRSGSPRPGALTVVSLAPPPGSARIVEVRPNGKTRVVWRCPNGRACGVLTGVDWAPDGRYLALTLDDVFHRSYLGLHIVDLATRRYVHMARDAEDRLGNCVVLETVAWSPGSGRLAFVCPTLPGSAIAVMRRNGTGAHRVETGLLTSSWPSWSPDGTRLAFAGSDRALRTPGASSIYAIRVDGTQRVLVARHGYAPSWSPDGKTIAYRARDGIRLVTPGGVDVTPHGHVVAPRGIPAWSLSGNTLAVSTEHGVYLVAKSGAGLRRVTSLGDPSVRPAWYPAKRAPAELRPDCGPC